MTFRATRMTKLRVRGDRPLAELPVKSAAGKVKYMLSRDKLNHQSRGEIWSVAGVGSTHEVW